MSLRQNLLLVASLFIAFAAVAEESSLEARFRNDVEILASDRMEGRGLGTKGIDLAADWIEARLESMGLEPGFGKSYRQPFPVKTGVELKGANRIAGLEASDWIPLGFSSSGPVRGEIAFVGYGIEAPPVGYRELEGLDLKGKVVLMLRYEPQERDEASPFNGSRPSRWSALRYRVLQARERGATAVIFATGPLQDEESDRLPALKNDGPESPAGIPVIQVKSTVAQRWMKGTGIDLLEFQKSVDRDLTPRSKASTGVTIDGIVSLESRFAEAVNLSGIIPGRGPLADEVVVIGAHYDHLGYGGEGSMKPNVKEIHNGADDNASGTVAAMLAVARMLPELIKHENRRTVAVVLFAAEEVGLAGSAYFVGKPPFPIGRVAAMVNLDMVGRLRDDSLVAFGVESAPQWSDLVTAASTNMNLKITTRGDGYGPSDHASFYGAQVPVLHLFTGTHEEYHAPEDDPETINAEGGARITLFTAALGMQLAMLEEKPQYARTSAAPVMEGDSRGYGAYLGTVPDFSSMEAEGGGVLLSDVRAGGPADRAGIRGGDRIVRMAGTRIENLYDMTFALQDHKPGDTIDVVVIRDGQELTLRATLTDRRAPAAPAPQAAAPTAPAHAAPAVAPSAAPSPHAAAVSPHTTAQEPAKKEPSFYDRRPGEDFVIVAGKPFDSTHELERHFRDIRQLTFRGENAEAYFSPDGTKLIYQATLEEGGCDQQYILDLATGENTLVSSGRGRTTCGYFDFPEADRIIYASTESGGAECPPPPDRSQGYTWPVYETFELWEANVDGSNARRLTNSPGYDAEATWCHRGGKFVFTSVRDGDLDLYEMNEAGDVKRLTDTPGYDGGAFYSPDCSEIVFRASRPTGEKLAEYQALLRQGLVRPSEMELFVMNADGSQQRQITFNGAANFGPYFHPDGNRIIYSSNAGASVREFDLWMISKEGGEPQQVTFTPGFDGFPQFSPDGKWFVWASNRADPGGSQTNLFIARWVE
ncbi:MAG TPA: M28 family peptidase [Thermoanaerobaculia bacterium]|nr:M28 family peptidase [Thermoanaerobaculia bacterium]